MVAEEPVVLGGQHGMPHQLRDVIEGDGDASLFADLGDQTARAGVDAQGHLQLDLAHGFGRGQRRRDVHIGAGKAENAEQQQAGRGDQGMAEQGKGLSFHKFDSIGGAAHRRAVRVATPHSVPRALVPGVLGQFVAIVCKLTECQAELAFNLTLGCDIFAPYVKRYSRFGA